MSLTEETRCLLSAGHLAGGWGQTKGGAPGVSWGGRWRAGAPRRRARSTRSAWRSWVGYPSSLGRAHRAPVGQTVPKNTCLGRRLPWAWEPSRRSETDKWRGELPQAWKPPPHQQPSRPRRPPTAPTLRQGVLGPAELACCPFPVTPFPTSLCSSPPAYPPQGCLQPSLCLGSALRTGRVRHSSGPANGLSSWLLSFSRGCCHCAPWR